MKTKGKWILSGIGAFFTAHLIVLLRFADVQLIGPEGTAIGLAGLNRFVFETLGVRMLWYEITDWLGIAAVLTAFVFAVAGLIQWIRRRSLKKVDKEILALGGLYLVVIGLYLLFERAVVNYRPILLPGSVRPEPSFPSSHTMLVCVIMGSAMMLLGKYVKKTAPRAVLRMLCALLIGITVIGRLISGVHWFTDILGGLLISFTLLSLYSGVLDMEKNSIVIRREKEEDRGKVEFMIRESFWNVYRPGCSEHYVIHVLRDDPAFVEELDLVMEKNGALIGQNMFMKTVIQADDGREIPVLTMGPICITPELKRRGYGKILLDESLKRAAALGFGAVLFEGNIGFYGKCGFDYARKFGIRYHDLPEGADDSFFLCRELIPGYLGGVTGVYQTPQGYYVKDEEVEAFDRAFPPKEKLKLPGQLFDR